MSISPRTCRTRNWHGDRSTNGAPESSTLRGAVDQAEAIGSLTEQVDGRERELDRSSAEIAALSGQLAEADVSRRRYVGIANALAIALVVAGVFAAMAWLP